MTRPLHLLALLPLLAAAACGPASSTDDDQLGSADAPPDAPPDALVLQVRQSGGFVPVGWDFRSVPQVSVYGDGRVLTPGPEAAVFPGPALPSVQAGRLEPDQVRRLVEDGREAVEGGADYGQPPIADAPATVVAVGTGEDREVVAAVALVEAGPPADEGSGVGPPGDAGLTGEQQELRERLAQYVAQVRDVAGQVAAEPYDADAFAVLALPYGDAAGVDGEVPEELAWPGPALGDGEQLASGTCVVVDEQLGEVRDAAAQATQETPWVDGGQRWRLSFRPLLPDEQTCQDVLGGPVPTGP